MGAADITGRALLVIISIPALRAIAGLAPVPLEPLTLRFSKAAGPCLGDVDIQPICTPGAPVGTDSGDVQT